MGASFGERRLSADKLREEADEASRQQALAAERLEQFRRNLRAGDRFEWRVPGRDYMTGVGTIIRLENDAMAFVQFDNVKISGQVTRYVPRSELRPVEKGRRVAGVYRDSIAFKPGRCLKVAAVFCEFEAERRYHICWRGQ